MTGNADNPTVRLLTEQLSDLPDWHRRRDLLSAREAVRRPEVAEHASGVATYAGELADALGVDPELADDIRDAAILHDIGKLAIEDAILHKPGRLDGRELEEMRRHAAYGEELLAASGAPALHREIALYHHERYDGFGYEGMKGEAIPFAARIVQVADVYEALVARRAYKAPVAPEDALLSMVADVPSPGFGRRAFDPGFLRTFVRHRLEADPRLARSEGGNPEDRARNEKLRDLRDFASSDPMLDYAAGDLPAGLVLKASGARLLHEVDEVGANVRLLAVVTAGGVLVNRSGRPDPEIRDALAGAAPQSDLPAFRAA